MVTPENGTITLKGLQTGKVWQISIYSSDVVGAFVTYSQNGLAGSGSQNFYILPEAAQVIDMSVVTGQTVAVAWNVLVNDVPIGCVIPFAQILTTLTTRSFPPFTLKQGSKLTLVQA